MPFICLGGGNFCSKNVKGILISNEAHLLKFFHIVIPFSHCSSLSFWNARLHWLYDSFYVCVSRKFCTHVSITNTPSSLLDDIKWLRPSFLFDNERCFIHKFLFFTQDLKTSLRFIFLDLNHLITELGTAASSEHAETHAWIHRNSPVTNYFYDRASSSTSVALAWIRKAPISKADCTLSSVACCTSIHKMKQETCWRCTANMKENRYRILRLTISMKALIVCFYVHFAPDLNFKTSPTDATNKDIKKRFIPCFKTNSKFQRQSNSVWRLSWKAVIPLYFKKSKTLLKTCSCSLGLQEAVFLSCGVVMNNAACLPCSQASPFSYEFGTFLLVMPLNINLRWIERKRRWQQSITLAILIFQLLFRTEINDWKKLYFSRSKWENFYRHFAQISLCVGPFLTWNRSNSFYRPLLTTEALIGGGHAPLKFRSHSSRAASGPNRANLAFDARHGNINQASPGSSVTEKPRLFIEIYFQRRCIISNWRSAVANCRRKPLLVEG